METDKDFLHKSFKELRIKHFMEVVEVGLKDQNLKQQLETIDLLKKCCDKEKTERRSSQIASKIKSAKFRQVQTVEQFDFSHSQLTKRIEKTYLVIHNNVDKNNLPKAIFVGNPGVGGH